VLLIRPPSCFSPHAERNVGCLLDVCIVRRLSIRVGWRRITGVFRSRTVANLASAADGTTQSEDNPISGNSIARTLEATYDRVRTQGGLSKWSHNMPDQQRLGVRLQQIDMINLEPLNRRRSFRRIGPARHTSTASPDTLATGGGAGAEPLQMLVDKIIATAP